jgi:hypothetical protein
VGAGTINAVAGQQAAQAGSMRGITTPGFVVQFPGVYKMNYTVFDGCHAPATKQVTVNAMCNAQAPSLGQLADVSSNFDCKNPTGTMGYNGGFTAVSLSGQQTAAAGLSSPGSQFTGANGAVESAGGSWTLASQANSGWGSPHCSIPTISSNPVAESCGDWQTSQNAAAGGAAGSGKALPSGYTTQQCCQCLYGNIGGGATIVVTPSTSSTSSTSGSGAASTSSQRGGLEAVTEAESSNLNLLLGLIIPLGLLLVLSIAVNIYMLNETRVKGGSSGPALQADSTGRDVELSIAPTRV